MRTVRTLTTTILLGAVATIATAQGTQFHLASAQIVEVDGGPRLLLAADGPMAYAVEPEPDGSAAPAASLRLRLYGVTPVGALTATPVAPFTLQAITAGRDTVLLVQATGVPPGQRLAVGLSAQASQLTIIVR